MHRIVICANLFVCCRWGIWLVGSVVDRCCSCFVMFFCGMFVFTGGPSIVFWMCDNAMVLSVRTLLFEACCLFCVVFARVYVLCLDC